MLPHGRGPPPAAAAPGGPIGGGGDEDEEAEGDPTDATGSLAGLQLTLQSVQMVPAGARQCRDHVDVTLEFRSGGCVEVTLEHGNEAWPDDEEELACTAPFTAAWDGEDLLVTCTDLFDELRGLRSPPLAVPEQRVWVLGCHGDPHDPAAWTLLSGPDRRYRPRPAPSEWPDVCHDLSRLEIVGLGLSDDPEDGR